jgi:hypothetical protein
MELQKYPALLVIRSSDIWLNTFLLGKPHPQPLSRGQGGKAGVTDLGASETHRNP